MDLEETGEYESVFRSFFSVERVEFEMAVLDQRKNDGEGSRNPGQMDRSIFLHSTEKCV